MIETPQMFSPWQLGDAVGRGEDVSAPYQSPPAFKFSLTSVTVTEIDQPRELAQCGVFTPDHPHAGRHPTELLVSQHPGGRVI